MAGDGNLRIGATVDKAAVEAGFQELDSLTAKVTRNISFSFEDCASKTKAAMRNISDGVKEAASSVSAESLKVAEATRVQAKAMADLRNATIVSKDAKVGDAEADSLLAAAQQRVVATSKGVAEAKRAEARAVAEAAEEETLSQNMVIRAFQRLKLAAVESLETVQEKMVETAEASGLEAEGISAGFSGISSLLGAGIAVGFAAHFLDDSAKMQVELEHLHTQTNINISSLAGLQQMMRQMGGDWEAAEKGLIRLERAQHLATEGGKQQARAFAEIGISMHDLQTLGTEDLLQRVATAMAGTDDASKNAAIAFTLFGRGGAALIPILKEQGAQLTANMKATGQLTGVTDASAKGAREWTEAVAKLAQAFRGPLAQAMQYIPDVAKGVEGVVHGVIAVIVTVAGVAAEAILLAIRTVTGAAKILYDIASGNFLDIKDDLAATKKNIVEDWRGIAGEISMAWAKTKRDFTEPFPIRAEVKTPEPEDLSGDGGGGKTKTGRAAREAKAPKELEPEDMTGALKLAEDEWIRGLEEDVRRSEELYREDVAAAHEALDEKMRLAKEDASDTARQAEQAYQLGRISAEQRLAILRDAAQKQYAIELEAVEQKQRLDLANTKAYQADLARELEIRRQYNRQIEELEFQAAQQTEHGWHEAGKKMLEDMNTVLLSMMDGHRKLAQTLAEVWNGIVRTFAQNVLKMAEQYLIGLLLQKQGQKSQILGDAKTAAANTYAAVSAIPVVGPFLAPPAAAGAFAAVLAFDSFNEGGMVTAGNGAHIPILAKAGERVLTPGQTDSFHRLLDSASRGGSKTIHNHLHYEPSINAYDRNGFRNQLRGHADDVAELMRGVLRPEAFA